MLVSFSSPVVKRECTFWAWDSSCSMISPSAPFMSLLWPSSRWPCWSTRLPKSSSTCIPAGVRRSGWLFDPSPWGPASEGAGATMH